MNQIATKLILLCPVDYFESTGLASLVVGSVSRKVRAGALCPVGTVETPAQFKGRPRKDAVIPMGGA